MRDESGRMPVESPDAAYICPEGAIIAKIEIRRVVTIVFLNSLCFRAANCTAPDGSTDAIRKNYLRKEETPVNDLFL